MAYKFLPPAIGVAAAIAITATMDSTGLSAFSALPLCPLLFLLWFWERHSRSSVGFVWGTPRGYALAVLFPILVMATLALIAAAAGQIDTSHTHWSRSLLILAVTAVATILLAMVTEEGFFRGWLWASLGRAGFGPISIIVLSSLAFALWHVSSVVQDTGLNPSPLQIPIYLLNAAVGGAIWGLMRWISGSVVVTSVSHGIWNGMAYVLFGVGKKLGALGIANTIVFGPESGILGLTFNAIFAAALFLWWRRARAEKSDRGQVLPAEVR